MASHRSVVSVLKAALAKLVERGWVKGQEGSRKNGYCMTGAIYASTKDYPLCERAIDALFDAIRPEDVPDLARQSSQNATMVQIWNDKDERQKRSIIAPYRRAIRSQG